MRTSIIVAVLVVGVLLVVFWSGALISPNQDTGVSSLPPKEDLDPSLDAATQTIYTELLSDDSFDETLAEEDYSFIDEDPAAYQEDSLNDF